MPQTAFEQLRACLEVIAEAAYRYEGSIEKIAGNSVCARFGAPLVYEDTPACAILAAWDMREAVWNLSLGVCIGINSTGMDSEARGTQQHGDEKRGYGRDIGLAQCLQEAAEPGQILVGAATYQLTRKCFAFNPPVPVSVKGIESPVPAYEVLQARTHSEDRMSIRVMESC